MFTIIGGDGKEYGPATDEQIRSWIEAGRASLETRAIRVGTNDLRRLGDFQEFSGRPEPQPPEIAPLSLDTPLGSGDGKGELASHGMRFSGALIDGMLKAICWMPAGFAAWGVLAEDFRAGRQPAPEELMAVLNEAMMKSLPFLLVLALVQCALLSMRAQSVGKLLVGTRIVSHQDGIRVGFGRAFFLRGTIPWIIEQIPLFGRLFWVIDVSFIFGADRRCLHDYIAGTRVVNA